MSSKTKGGNDCAKADANWQSLKKAMREAYGVKPNNINGQWTLRTVFYKEQLELILKGLIEIECPDTWDTDFVLTTLLFDGKFAVIDSSAGIVPMNCGTYGVNMYYRNSHVVIANPVLGDMDATIGVDCELVYLMDNKWYRTFNPIVDIYAEKLANCDASIDVNLMNSRVAWLAKVENQKQANEVKMSYEKVSQGEPIVVVGDNSGATTGMEMYNTDVKNTYICDLVQTEKKAIWNEFFTLVGINNTNIEKKERLITGEVDGNVDEIECNISRIRTNLKYCENKVNSMFGNILHFKFPYWDRLQNSGGGQKKNGNEPAGNDGNS